ncbi:hypothetical protein LCGC14_0817370 [marine sediment metagenome]|uniref:Uncharacterized protein n=1 Tax=marine sediment metagenome TaxID=412755 RepID=A0A0F9Q577_9ZZZZ
MRHATFEQYCNDDNFRHDAMRHNSDNFCHDAMRYEIFVTSNFALRSRWAKSDSFLKSDRLRPIRIRSGKFPPPAGRNEMSNFERVKSVEKGGFATIEAARANAQKFADIGGKVHEGGARNGAFGWSGEIAVHDSQVSVKGAFGCGRCATTGHFITYVENGKPRGPGGICFRCEGKGFHTLADRKRNLYHDMHFICRAA